MLIIDGYNLLFHRSWPLQGFSLEQQRENLLIALSQCKRLFHYKKLIVVFDGRGWKGPFSYPIYSRGLEVIYVTKADDKIVDLAEKMPKIQVVTADRQLQSRVKKVRGFFVSPEEFLKNWRLEAQHLEQHLEQDKEGKKSLPNLEIEKWLKLFGLQSEIEIPPLNRPCKGENTSNPQGEKLKP